MDAKTLGGDGGRIGNPPYEPTDEDRANVRTWIKVTSADAIAGFMGISRDTLDRHYKEELSAGRFELVAKLGGIAIKMALEGDRTMLIFCLRTIGKWSSRLELTGPNGGPMHFIDIRSFLETCSDEELAIAEPLFERILASGATPGVPGLDLGAQLGFATDQAGAAAPAA